MNKILRCKITTVLSIACMTLTTMFAGSIPAYADETSATLNDTVSDEIFTTLEEEEYSEGGLYQSYRTSKTEETSVQVDFEIKMPEHFAYDVYADLMNTQNGDVYKFSITSANGYTDRGWVEPGIYKLMQVYVHGDNVGAYPFVWDANALSFEANTSYKYTPEFQNFDEVTEQINKAYDEREKEFGLDFLGNLIENDENTEEEGNFLAEVYDFDMSTTPYMTQSRPESGRIWVIGQTDYTYNLKVEITTVDTAVLPTRLDDSGNTVPEFPETDKTYFKIAVNDAYESFSVYIDGEAITSEVFSVPLSGFYGYGSDITLYFDTSFGDFKVGDIFTAYVLSYESIVIQEYEGEGHTLWELTPKNNKTLFDALKDSETDLVIRIEKSGNAGTAVWSISQDGGESFGEQEYAKDVLEFEDFTITFKQSEADPTLFVKGGTFSFTYSEPEVYAMFSTAAIVALVFLIILAVGGYILLNKKMKEKMPKDNQYTIQR